MNYSKRNLLTVAEGLLVAIALFIFLQNLWPDTSLVIFQARDLSRAWQLVNGHSIFFGPETQGSGHLPGGFYYYLIGLPIFLGCGVKGVWYLMIAFTAISGALIWAFFRRHFNSLVAAVALICLFEKGPVIYVLRAFLNPSFLPIFTVSSIILLLRVFALNGVTESTRSRTWIAFCFLIGLALQVHFTAIFLLLTALTIQIVAPKIGARRIQSKMFSIGLGAFFLTMIPFFIWAVADNYGVTIGQEAPAGNDWSFHSWGIFQKDIQWATQSFDFYKFVVRIGNLFNIWKCATLLLLYFIYRKLKVSKPETSSINLRTAMIVLLTGMAFSLIPSAYFLTTSEAPRYAVVFVIFQALAMTIFAGSFLRKIKYESLIAVIALTTFAVISVETNKLDKDLKSPTYSIADGQSLVRQIDQLYGWDYKKIRFGIFVFGQRFEYSFQWLDYGLSKAKPISSSLLTIDGIFFGVTQMKNIVEAESYEPIKWLRDSHADSSVLDAVQNGELELLPAIREGSFIAIPYRFISDIRTSDHFHNLGMPYSLSGDMPEDFRGPFSFKAEFSNCDNRFEECRGFVGVENLISSNGIPLLRIRIFEPALSMHSVYEEPRWTEGISNPALKIQCGESVFRSALADALGFRYDHWKDLTLRAPFIRTIKNPCGPNSISQVEFSYDSVSVSSEGGFFVLPGKTWILSQKKQIGHLNETQNQLVNPYPLKKSNF